MIRHIVAQGQTPAELAERYGVCPADLVALNGLDPDCPVPDGLMLWVPEPDRPKAEPAKSSEVVLIVSPAVFSALEELQDANGGIVFRIVRGCPGETLTLQLPG